jgi:hypothetical protein
MGTKEAAGGHHKRGLCPTARSTDEKRRVLFGKASRNESLSYADALQHRFKL